MAIAQTRTASSRRSIGPARSAAKDTLEHYERFVSTLTILDDSIGERVGFRLQDWQRALLADYFDGRAETLVEVPSGSGKTTLFATVGLHHATYVRHKARVLIISSSGKQAQQMWEAMASFIEGSVDLQRWWKAQMYGLGRVKSLTDRGVIEILSPSPKVAEGDIPSLVLADELHRFADDGRGYSILLSKLQKRTARVLGCTTAGDDDESYLGRRRMAALEGAGQLVEGHLVPDLRAKGAAVKSTLGREEVRPDEYYTVARDGDGDTAWHEWSLPDGADPEDLDEVLRCNPADHVTREGLRRTRKLLAARPWDWLRQHCNRWALGERSALDAAVWHELGAGVDLSALDGLPKWVGLDMGGVSDSTAVIPVWRLPDEAPSPEDVAQAEMDEQPVPVPSPRFVTAAGRIVWPPGDGEWTLVEDVLEALDAVVALPGDFQGLVFDRAKGGGYVAQQLERQRSWTIIDHGQAAEMDDASELLARVVVERRIAHDARPEVDRQVLAASAKRSRRSRWYLSKPPSQPHRKIDAAVALAMALRVANAGPARAKRKLRMHVLGSDRKETTP